MVAKNELGRSSGFNRLKKRTIGLLLASTAVLATGCATEAKQNDAPPHTDSYSAPANPSTDLPPTSASPSADLPSTSTAPNPTTGETQPYRVGDEISPAPEKLPEPKDINQAASASVGILGGTIEVQTFRETGRRASQENGLLQNSDRYTTDILALPAGIPVGFVELDRDNAKAGLIEAQTNVARVDDNNGVREVRFIHFKVATIDPETIEALSGSWTSRDLYQNAGMNTGDHWKVVDIGMMKNGESKFYDAPEIAALSEREKQELIDEVMKLLGEITKDHRSSFVEYEIPDVVPDREK